MSLDADALAEMARNRGLKLRKSRVRDPAKSGFGKYGLVDPAGEPVFGFERGKPGADAEEVATYLRGAEAQDWKASLKELGVKKRKRSSSPSGEVAARSADGGVEGDSTDLSIGSTATSPAVEEPDLREATPKDAAQLVSLFTLLDHRIDAKTLTANLKAMTKAGDRLLVIAQGKQLLAACSVHRTVHPHRRKPVGRISILVVAEDQRGKGLGRQLVEEAERRLAALGCGMIEVTSNDRLTAAHAFYRHLGYQRTSMRFAKELPSG